MLVPALEIFPDEVAGAVEPCLDRRTCRFERMRDLADGHFLEVTHQDDLAEMWRQGFQSVHQIYAQFISGDTWANRAVFSISIRSSMPRMSIKAGSMHRRRTTLAIQPLSETRSRTCPIRR